MSLFHSDNEKEEKHSGILGAFGSVEKVGVAPEPKRVGPASQNLEYG